MRSTLIDRARSGIWCITPDELQRLQGASIPDLRITQPMDMNSRGMFTQAGKVAVIEINGVLGKNLDMFDIMFGGVDYDMIAAQIDAAEASQSESILFHIKSPGGMALGAPEVAERIAAIEKPTVAYTDFLMCSGGYYLGSQCDAVYSSGSAIMGSIGVILTLIDASQALADQGIKVNAFTAGKWKATGAQWKALTDEERARFQTEVSRVYDKFAGAVLSKRTIDQVNMEGQTFDGEQAVEAGLSDGIYTSLNDLLDDMN